MAKKRTFNCGVKGLNDGKNTLSVGMSIDRSDLSLEEGDALLCGAMLDFKLTPIRKDAKDQKELFDTSLSVEFTASCPGFSGLNPSGYTLSLKLDGDSDLNALRNCKFKKCQAVVTRKGAIEKPQSAKGATTPNDN